MKRVDKQLLGRLTGAAPRVTGSVDVEAFAEPMTTPVRVELRYRGKLHLGTVIAHQHFESDYTCPVLLDTTCQTVAATPSEMTVIDGSTPGWALPQQSQPPGI